MNQHVCPYCNREVSTFKFRFNPHNLTPGKKAVPDTCPLSEQPIPVTGESEWDYERRAKLIADLAEQVQDQDPTRVWLYLTALPAGELQKLLMLSLAALNLDGTVEDMWKWVTDLPVARTE